MGLSGLLGPAEFGFCSKSDLEPLKVFKSLCVCVCVRVRNLIRFTFLKTSWTIVWGRSGSWGPQHLPPPPAPRLDLWRCSGGRGAGRSWNSQRAACERQGARELTPDLQL